MSRRRRPVLGFLRLCLRLLLLAVVWLLGVAAWIVHVGNRDEAGPADAIVVLGAAAYDAVPSPVFEARIEHGLDLYRAGHAPTLIFTGGYGGAKARFSEAQVARRYALRHDVPDSAILIESRSRTTLENLIETRALMQAHDLHRVIIVSDPLHMARALRAARRLGIDAVGSPTPSTRFRTFRTQREFLLREVYFFHRDLLDAAHGALAR
ncbi:protein sanA-like protein [Lysobacteraceae bacterium NML93-0792]|nr:protein sanA-like protein [Xanthomonadaceae bacterium NML93-0792]PBS15082.1 protein sanA-like protein [Xanthomonadaceae bacterium NML93-0793]PBS17910.1 protein sanA-like protein [Xanthomonadaceae bacterium NML93-0831]